MSVTIETIYVVMTTRQLVDLSCYGLVHCRVLTILVKPTGNENNFSQLENKLFFFLYSPCLLPWGRLPNHPQEVHTWQLYMHRHTHCHSNRSQVSRMSIHGREGEKSFVCIQESPRRMRLDHFRANRMD